MTSRSLVLFATLVVGAGACTNAEDTSIAAVDTIGSEAVTSTAVSRPTSTARATEPAMVLDLPDELSELAFADDGQAPSSTTSAPPVAPAPTSGSGGAPVTTIASGGGAPVDIYQGILGNLDPDELVVEPVVAPPTAAPGHHPLTGLAGDVPVRPAAVVKVDNGGPARPQTGLNSADIVIEEEVEGGITRFAAVFHSNDSIVGPVRSGRTTDIGILVGLGSPLLMYSGANDVTDALLLRQSALQNRSAARSSGYWRQSGRRAPSNLYTDTAPHQASATGGPPPAQFAYRAAGEPSPGEPATGLTVAFGANTVEWSWDGSAWLRSQGGRAHTVESGARVSAANVVVIEVARVGTGMVDSSGATVPEFVFVGSGRATVFTDGKRLVGTWTRPTLASVATLTTSGGEIIALTPGRTWIELIEADAGILR